MEFSTATALILEQLSHYPSQNLIVPSEDTISPEPKQMGTKSRKTPKGLRVRSILANRSGSNLISLQITAHLPQRVGPPPSQTPYQPLTLALIIISNTDPGCIPGLMYCDQLNVFKLTGRLSFI